jgi:hypothetical protein
MVAKESEKAEGGEEEENKNKNKNKKDWNSR